MKTATRPLQGSRGAAGARTRSSGKRRRVPTRAPSVFVGVWLADGACRQPFEFTSGQPLAQRGGAVA